MLVTYTAAALSVIPDLLVMLFNARNETYNLAQAKGTLKLIEQRFTHVPEASWPALERQLQEDFAPLQLRVIFLEDNSLAGQERAALAAGANTVRMGDYGSLVTALAPLPGGQVVELT